MRKQNTIKVNPLMDKFANTLSQIEYLEKQVNKIYKKFISVVYTPELSKCLFPELTDSDKHLQRIKLIHTSLSLKPQPCDKQVITNPIKLKTASAEQDLAIITQALILQNHKLAFYELLHPLATALNLPIEAELIEQTITDNRNTNTWLRQIVKNIITPILIAES
jgi:ferritin-like metal-binding protein YciE